MPARNKDETTYLDGIAAEFRKEYPYILPSESMFPLLDEIEPGAANFFELHMETAPEGERLRRVEDLIVYGRWLTGRRTFRQTAFPVPEVHRSSPRHRVIRRRDKQPDIIHSPPGKIPRLAKVS